MGLSVPEHDRSGGTMKRFDPIVNILPGGYKHLEGRDGRGNPIHGVTIEGAILGYGKTKEAAIKMAMESLAPEI